MAALVDSSNNINRQKWCSISYKIRCFYSKGAFLVLFWMSLISLVFAYLCYLILFQGIDYARIYSKVALVPAVPFLMCAPIVGWIADARCGNYRVFRVGASLLFSATVVGSICVLILVKFDMPPHGIVSRLVSDGISPIVYIVGFVGGIACLVTALQLGLDQMPDASSANITSFIAWFVFSIALGAWTLDTGFRAFACFIRSHMQPEIFWTQVFSLVPVIAMSVICCSLFLLAPKWMTIEPNCPQSIKTIYQVLKFAAKHKAPLNRSALTYWEEDVPSRMDLGKSRYGGPFTTEEVEDVKTFFKILIMSLPIFIISCSLSPKVYMERLHGFTTRFEADLVLMVTYSPAWVIIIMTFVYEFAIYPLLRNRLPSILKRIGIISFLIFILNSVELVLATAISSCSLNLSPWSDIAYSVIFSCIVVFLLTTILEFVCAQSPYKMRGLLLGYVLLLYLMSMSVGVIINICLSVGPYCQITEKSVFTALSLVGFVIHCLLATWYKRRVREENYDVHRVVEEVYDRYLTQRPTV
ncbi:solute carrier family 15 member 4-like [Halichondria panicea]|uniref:solute carrier family 15 member 4-like n=1 Tax=Halichondria panicea TaxID=6063 RepID=UPI00312B4445